MNIIDAIINLIKNPKTQVFNNNLGNNRANNTGDALEEYVKDIFANTLDQSGNKRIEMISNVFSYLGNNANPPDAMLKNGDAIEVKKIEQESSALALNSSYPKRKIKSSSPMISKACREAENWSEKDIIYVVGVVKNNKLKQLCMVYGMDYCASEECYQKIKETIKNGVETIPEIEFAQTRELGHINRIDPLGITYLRVRGMWGIENPWRVFDYVYQTTSKSFNFMSIINNNKWRQFDNTQDLLELEQKTPNLKIEDIRIKNPDNPAQLNEAKLISFSK